MIFDAQKNGFGVTYLLQTRKITVAKDKGRKKNQFCHRMVICLKQGFNVQQIVVLLAAAAALGDAGSPASDTTLGPTSGLNADGQHNHIYDTCIPTFLHYNIALIIFAIIGIWLFS